jgi:hypothetical protein
MCGGQVVERQALATRFLAFCGRERFRRFVLQLIRGCRRKGRLMFWQEELWAAFAEIQPDGIPLSFEAISEALRVCPVHDQPLRSEDVPIVYGLIHFTQGHVQAREMWFPFANEVAYDGCCVGPQQRATVLFCDACRQESLVWHGRTGG